MGLRPAAPRHGVVAVPDRPGLAEGAGASAVRRLVAHGEAVSEYATFLKRKTQAGSDGGFEPLWLPDFLFDFQRALVEWAIRKGRAAIFADCGLGKTPMLLVWAENVTRHTNRPVLVLTPLAVGPQMLREATKFGIEAERARDGRAARNITVANYERLHHFDPADFAGVVCDESSILKSFDGTRRALVTDFLRKVPYRLLCTATAAPNDYVELGTSSEALGYLGHMDMLNRFFVNQNSTSDTKGRWRGFGAPRAWEGKLWRFKAHAERPFWRWACSWARAVRRPSDLGFDDGRFQLPPLDERESVVEARRPADGMLFDLPAVGLREERELRRRTLAERCEAAARLVAGTDRPAVVWCHLNAEGDLLARIIPDSEQVSGDDADEAKEERFEAFRHGRLRVLVIKPKIGAWGLNWEHCAHVVYFPSHSYEQYYQAVRRCWRFGQDRAVAVDLVCTEADRRVMANLRRKAAAADKMFADLVAQMHHAQAVSRANGDGSGVEAPAWLTR